MLSGFLQNLCKWHSSSIIFLKTHSSFHHKCLISLFSIASLFVFARQHKKSVPSGTVCGTLDIPSDRLSFFNIIYFEHLFYTRKKKKLISNSWSSKKALKFSVCQGVKDAVLNRNSYRKLLLECKVSSHLIQIKWLFKKQRRTDPFYWFLSHSSGFWWQSKMSFLLWSTAACQKHSYC